MKNIYFGKSKELSVNTKNSSFICDKFNNDKVTDIEVIMVAGKIY